MIGKTITELMTGDHAEITRVVEQDDIAAFVDAVGDYNPVKAGDVITARAEVVEMLPERNRIRLQTVCVNQRGEEVLSGEAWIMPSRTRVVYEERPADAAACTPLAWNPWAWTAQAMTFWGMLSLSMLSGALPRRG